MERREYIECLLQKYRNGEASPEEVNHLLLYIKAGEDEELVTVLINAGLLDKPLPELMSSDRIQRRLDSLYTTINKVILETQPKKKRYNYTYISIAAAILVLFVIGMYFYSRPTEPDDIDPGGNRAILSVGNNAIELREDQEGIVIGNSIIYGDGSTVSDISLDGAVDAMMTLTVPQGGQYQLVLPDGTKVWINAGSSLEYSTQFGADRVVRLKGEGYFEIAQNSSKPFSIDANGHTIQVLGTSLNITAYNESEANITLVDGSIKVLNKHTKEEKLLQPGQQATITDQSIALSDADTEVLTAWKDNLFLFRDQALADIIPQLERWYGVQFEIKDQTVLKQHFYGTASRNEKLSKILALISGSSNLSFRIDERRVSIDEKK